MKCWTVKRRMLAYLDNSLPDKERLALRAHLHDCRTCAQRSDGYRLARRALRSLPHKTQPPELTMRLRVNASRARDQQFRGGSRFGNWIDRLKLSLDHL